MNEVQNNVGSLVKVSRVVTSSNEGGSDAIKNTKQGLDTSTDEKAVDVKKLDKAVTKMNEFVQREQRDLKFSIDEDTGSTVVKVLERGTGELIRQIPNQTFLEFAAEAMKHESLKLINTYT